MTYKAAIEAGVDIVDCCLSPLSGGTAQPSTQAFNASLKGTKYDPKLNEDAIHRAEPLMDKIVTKYLKNGLLKPKALTVNPNILKYQVPGGMLSNLMNQLDKLPNRSTIYDGTECTTAGAARAGEPGGISGGRKAGGVPPLL